MKTNVRLLIPGDTNPCKECIVRSCCSEICVDGIKKVLEDLNKRHGEKPVFVDYKNLI